MKLAFIGASHWHTPLYVEPARAVPSARIVGVSDPDGAAVARWQAALGCAGASDYRRLCEDERPDFVFALGRHVDMAETARYLIDSGIPFAIEKPCGLDTDEVREIAARAAAAGIFAAVPLVFRNGDLFELLVEAGRAGGVQHLAFRFIAGFASRYPQAGCAWMLDPAQSGGGSTINLSVHFFDLFRQLAGGEVRVAASAMSNAAWGHAIEDYSAVALAGPSGLCMVETGYLFPAPAGVFDLHYACRTADGYLVVPDAETVEIVANDGARERRKVTATNMPLYRAFVADVLERVSAGRPPLASLADMVPVMELVDAAYEGAARAAGRRFNRAAPA